MLVSSLLAYGLSGRESLLLPFFDGVFTALGRLLYTPLHFLFMDEW